MTFIPRRIDETVQAIMNGIRSELYNHFSIDDINTHDNDIFIKFGIGPRKTSKAMLVFKEDNVIINKLTEIDGAMKGYHHSTLGWKEDATVSYSDPNAIELIIAKALEYKRIFAEI